MSTSNEELRENANETTVLLPVQNNVITPQTRNLDEALYIFQKAVPVFFASFLQYIFSVASVFTLGHMGYVELAALSLSSMFASVTGISIIYGATSALDTLCPQGYTSGNPKMVGVYLQRAIIIIILGFIPISFIWWESGIILVYLGQDEEASAYAQKFLRWSILGAPATFIFWCVEKFLQGQGIMQATSYVLIIISPISIILNYALVWWEPIALGFIGAPIATNISNWLMLILSILYIKYIDGHQAWGGWTRACLDDWSSFTRLAIPGILTACADWWIYESIALASGYFGSISLAAHRLQLQIGATCSATGILIFRDSLGYLFTDKEEVIKLTATILPLCALFQISDATGIIGGGILRGQGRQKTISIIYLSAYYKFALPVGLLLAFKFNYELFGLWSGVTGGSILMGIGIFTAVITTNWEWEVEECKRRIKVDSLEDEILEV
ncbi:MATE efflux family protein [Rhizophagus clarus]|uniref:MATE efflux family protein n=1 Tax=Rhizophagus clarus TaxID=94130 RepID=A0A8H3QK16_9GLOM|nr:MATE efflux family protein [Rhizophagus clarus]